MFLLDRVELSRRHHVDACQVLLFFFSLLSIVSPSTKREFLFNDEIFFHPRFDIIHLLWTKKKQHMKNTSLKLETVVKQYLYNIVIRKRSCLKTQLGTEKGHHLVHNSSPWVHPISIHDMKIWKKYILKIVLLYHQWSDTLNFLCFIAKEMRVSFFFVSSVDQLSHSLSTSWNSALLRRSDNSC